ncbi:MAG: response regulator transcription factor [Oscillatoriophycideae cyanobacterium NC_groundwater_1537_Pr4_S-0.65um_50_18]|nr:response regulator transcription factor [Oscillatoriophycideae cyanobacterium NC_groundwater_1537_Pr4_S-0.65um_50_18]
MSPNCVIDQKSELHHSTRPYRVLIVDNHAMVRAGFRALLQSLEDIEVVGEAGDGREALRLVALHQPAIVLMDIAMPDMNGLEATARLKKEFLDVRVIILSMHANEEYVYQALRAGAMGYLLKDGGTSELELAIQAITHGETYLSPTVSKHVINDYMRRVSTESNPIEQLTPRQREILQLIAGGKSTKEIAEALYISVKTVETHRMQLMDRLDIHDVAGLVRYAIRTGLVLLEE